MLSVCKKCLKIINVDIDKMMIVVLIIIEILLTQIRLISDWILHILNAKTRAAQKFDGNA